MGNKRSVLGHNGNLRLIFDELDSLLAHIEAPNAVLLNLPNLIYYLIVDFVWNHGQDLGCSIREPDFAFQVFLGIVVVKNVDSEHLENHVHVFELISDAGTFAQLFNAVSCELGGWRL